MVNADVTIPRSYVAGLLTDTSYLSVVVLLEAHPASFEGCLPISASETSIATPLSVNGAMPLPTRVDQWVAATIDYPCRQMDSGIDHDVVTGYIGRRYDLVQLVLTRK